mgnify:CR=1 FL=1
MREISGVGPSIEVRASYDEGAFEIHRAEATMLLDAQFDWFGDAIKAQVVLVHVNFGKKLTFELLELHFVDSAFKDGFLYTLADTLASLGDATQAFASGRGFSGYVVGDDDKHELFSHVGQVAFHFAAQGACHETGLDEG